MWKLDAVNFVLDEEKKIKATLDIIHLQRTPVI